LKFVIGVSALGICGLGIKKATETDWKKELAKKKLALEEAYR